MNQQHIADDEAGADGEDQEHRGKGCCNHGLWGVPAYDSCERAGSFRYGPIGDSTNPAGACAEIDLG